MDHIGAILYINLAHRTDRNEHILKELHAFCDPTRVHRIDAVLDPNGAIGCAKSHIKALQYAQSHPEWRHVLIVEDDFTVAQGVDVNRLIQLLYNTAEFDIGLLTHNTPLMQHTPTSHESIKRVQYSQTASAYIIRQEYISTLIQNITEAVESMERHGVCHENSFDIYWNRLTATGAWYCVYPAVGYQCESYSDIQKHVTNYGC